MTTTKMTRTLQQGDFDTATRESTRVLVDFGATWCPPCRALEPVYEATAGAFAGQVVFGKVDVDDEPGLAERFHVHSIPTVVALENGQEVGRVSGAMSAARLSTLVQGFVDGNGFGRAVEHHHHHHA